MTVLRGGAIALVVLVADQATKWALVGYCGIAERPIEVLPFFNLVMVWNTGISFGLFQSGSAYAPYILSAVSLVIVCGLLIWLRRASGRMETIAIGLVIGGALGNTVDRLRWGAVADFFDLHVAGYHWPAFNIADSAIVVGVGLLLIDSLFRSRGEAT